jgi:hypothetical protein
MGANAGVGVAVEPSVLTLTLSYEESEGDAVPHHQSHAHIQHSAEQQEHTFPDDVNEAERQRIVVEMEKSMFQSLQADIYSRDAHSKGNSSPASSNTAMMLLNAPLLVMKRGASKRLQKGFKKMKESVVRSCSQNSSHRRSGQQEVSEHDDQSGQNAIQGSEDGDEEEEEDDDFDEEEEHRTLLKVFGKSLSDSSRSTTVTNTSQVSGLSQLSASQQQQRLTIRSNSPGVAALNTRSPKSSANKTVRRLEVRSGKSLYLPIHSML